jgi:hypothetical protein
LRNHIGPLFFVPPFSLGDWCLLFDKRDSSSSSSEDANRGIGQLGEEFHDMISIEIFLSRVDGWVLTWNFELKSKGNCDNGVCVFLSYDFVLAFCSCQDKNTQQSHGYYINGFAALPGSQFHIQFEWCRDRIFHWAKKLLIDGCKCICLIVA